MILHAYYSDIHGVESTHSRNGMIQHMSTGLSSLLNKLEYTQGYVKNTKSLHTQLVVT